MVNAFNAAITAKADGISVCLVSLTAFNGPTNRALGKGIPVLSYNADAPNNRLAYIGQDLYLSGYNMGQRVVDLVPSGDVALFIATPGQLNIQPRIDGLEAAIKKFGKGKIKTTDDGHRCAPARRAGEGRGLLPRAQERQGHVRRRRRHDPGHRPGHEEVRPPEEGRQGGRLRPEPGRPQG